MNPFGEKDGVREVENAEDVSASSITSSTPEAIVRAMTAQEYAECERKLKRKLDFRLLAVVAFIYILNFLDRNNIAATGVTGIQKILHLTSTQYSTAVSILFIGYILMQVPSNIFLAQLRPSLYIPCCVALWGTISALQGTVQDASGLYATRFFLGIVEAAFYPGAVFLIGSWYKRSEMGWRIAIVYSGSQIGSATSGLIAAGIDHGLNGVRGMPTFRWIFIIEGSITVCIAFIAAALLPDYPQNTRWLSKQERAVAQYRLIEDAGEPDADHLSWSDGFGAAFRDWRTYVFALMFACVLVTAATQNFFPSVVNTLGFSTIPTLLLTVPPYVFGAFVMISNNLSADHFRNSSFHIMWPLGMAIVGFIIASSTLSTWPRYFAMFLFVAGGHGANAVTTAWTQKTMIRPRIKRAAATAFVNACGNTSQIWTAYLYSADAKPRYVLAMSVNASFAFIGILLVLFMRITLQRANAKLEAAERALEQPGEDTAPEGHRSFRYIT